MSKHQYRHNPLTCERCGAEGGYSHNEGTRVGKPAVLVGRDEYCGLVLCHTCYCEHHQSDEHASVVILGRKNAA